MIKTAIHRTAHAFEQVFDRIRGQRDKRRIIEPYIGYATPNHRVVRGRVLTNLRRNKPMPTQSRWTNFKQMFALFLTDEVADVEVRSAGATTRSDEEGYFTLRLPRDDGDGWSEVEVQIVGEDSSAICPVLVARDAAEFGVISDIDDTMLETGAYSLIRNLWTSMTGNALTRRIFPDAVPFMKALSDDRKNPIYYVSSSPWNLYNFLNQIFARSGLVEGPTFLRDLGLSKTQFITGTHGDHKDGSIDTILDANPDLQFVLIGDTGQHDAFVYRDAIERHPGRIKAVVLREPGPGPDAKSKTAMEEIKATGCTLLHAPSFEGFAAHLLRS